MNSVQLIGSSVSNRLNLMLMSLCMTGYDRDLLNHNDSRSNFLIMLRRLFIELPEE